MLQPELRCVEFVEQVSDWLDGGLSENERVLIEEHLAFCSPCNRYLDQFRAGLRLIRESEGRVGEAPPPAVRNSLLEAFRQKRTRGVK
jgi:predicted anti-sigma-YlaC factor YlaD